MSQKTHIRYLYIYKKRRLPKCLLIKLWVSNLFFIKTTKKEDPTHSLNSSLLLVYLNMDKGLQYQGFSLFLILLFLIFHVLCYKLENVASLTVAKGKPFVFLKYELPMKNMMSFHVAHYGHSNSLCAETNISDKSVLD